MSQIKMILLCLSSAILGGLIVAGGVLLWPSLLSNTPGSTQVTDIKESGDNEIPETEKDLLDSIARQQEEMRNQFDSFFNDDFFLQDDPFEEMRKFRKRMQGNIKDSNGSPLSSPFDSWFGGKFGGGTAHDIRKREDENFVYYEIKVENVKTTTVETKIENGHLMITGKMESSKTQNSEENGFSNNSIFSSTFSRTFPLPAEIDENSMEMDSEGERIVIKFSKRQI